MELDMQLKLRMSALQRKYAALHPEQTGNFNYTAPCTWDLNNLALYESADKAKAYADWLENAIDKGLTVTEDDAQKLFGFIRSHKVY
jgi:hypothetical protein